MKELLDLETRKNWIQSKCDHEIVVVLHQDKFEAECAFCGKKYYHKMDVPYPISVIHMEEEVYASLVDEQKMFLVRQELWECKMNHRHASNAEWCSIIQKALENKQ